MTQASIQELLSKLGIQKLNPSWHTGTESGSIKKSKEVKLVASPINNTVLAEVELAEAEQYEHVIQKASSAFPEWRNWPAPKRGEIVRQIGDELRKYKEELGMLVTLEMGKSKQEGLGEVQEMIDICDFAVGLSRQLCGQTFHSERANHRMYDQYHPLGIVGVISAFNFPVAVWSWNAMLGAICGDVMIWKPSEKTPLSAIACHKIIEKVLQINLVPEGVFSLIIGDGSIGEMIAKDKRVALVSATGSTRMGKKVAVAVAERLGKSLLELGGNNAIILTPHANLEIAIRAVVFGAVGTCGQRCTSTRRLIVHEGIYEEVKAKLQKAYKHIKVGNPLEAGILVGPLIDQLAVNSYLGAIEKAKIQGGKIITESGSLEIQSNTSHNYVYPCIIEINPDAQIVQEETFAPILYLLKYEGEIENAIAIQNNVSQGLSSAVFTDHVREMERFLAANGSDCGIANVNIGTSGAEIGGAFGGEKDTGGGRESGSDAWKAYMRRQTNTINYGTELPLAQGIIFEL